MDYLDITELGVRIPLLTSCAVLVQVDILVLHKGDAVVCLDGSPVEEVVLHRLNHHHVAFPGRIREPADDDVVALAGKDDEAIYLKGLHFRCGWRNH